MTTRNRRAVRAPLFLSRLLHEPQLIEPAAGHAVLRVLAPGAEVLGAWDDDDDGAGATRDAREFRVVNGTAIIPIVGELVHRGAFLRPASGCCSYQAVAAALDDAMSDDGIRRVVLDVDSPGGEGAGCLDLSERIRGMRGRKPLWGVINQRACSAAYALVSACDPGRVFIGADGKAGSVGVVACHTDVSKLLDEAGVVVTYLYAGARKIDGAPELPLSDEARGKFMADITAMYGRFCSVVATNRGLSADAVRATEAVIYRGEDAVKAGLADAIATMEEVLSMTVPTTGAPSGSRLTTGPGGTEKLDASPTAAVPCAGCTTPDQCKAAGACADGKEQAVTPQDKAGAVELTPHQVVQACAAAGLPELAVVLTAGPQTTATMETAIAGARQVLDAGMRLKQEPLARRLIATPGLSLAVARDLMTTAAASADAGIVTDTTRASTPGTAGALALNASNVYAAMNSGRGVPKKG